MEASQYSTVWDLSHPHTNSFMARALGIVFYLFNHSVSKELEAWHTDIGVISLYTAVGKEHTHSVNPNITIRV